MRLLPAYADMICLLNSAPFLAWIESVVLPLMILDVFLLCGIDAVSFDEAVCPSWCIDGQQEKQDPNPILAAEDRQEIQLLVGRPAGTWPNCIPTSRNKIPAGIYAGKLHPNMARPATKHSFIQQLSDGANQ
ncbi:hypothetical protein Nepgr_016359 [Nepenthes gracilis]|uniref:Uncharacterized protein n=1 Tax=Nepenthes gracilis TaxID=150966 RepID=A0AAD3XRJ5_NEPGR|nr:hypothetical protein Nepgr_016359 [Nepenthes gracilis]